MITTIRTDEDYKAALCEIEKLIVEDARVGTPAGDHLNLLSLLVQDYEQKQIASETPDPIDAIKFRMEQMDLKPRDLVPLIGSRSKVSEVLSRKRPLTLSMVRALHKALGIPAKALVREQSLFGDHEESIEWNRFPIREMINRGWIGAPRGSISESAEGLVRSFLAPLGNAWAPAALYKQTRYVRSARQIDVYALAAWNARVCIRALEITPSVKFDPKLLTVEFMHELAHLSTLTDGPVHAKEYLSKIGVTVIIEPHLPEMYIDGAALLLSDDRPAIGLTIRHDRLDNFWFVLMHELIHIAHHLGSDTTAIFDDLDVPDENSAIEKEADELAGQALIPDEEWQKSPARSLRTPDAVQHLANRLRIHPAIIAGRIRHHYKSYRVLSRLVGQGEVRCLFPEMRGK
jgi:HTH-type transcriptional regulator/antitoxin HigA